MAVGVSLQVVAVLAPIDATCRAAWASALLLFSVTAQAQSENDAAILGEEASGVRVEELRLRNNVYLQQGNGYQSAYGNVRGPGSEQVWVVEPQISARIRQNDHIRHDIFLGVDIVTAASADGIDLITEASRVNESTTLNAQTTIEDDGSDYSARYGIHVEEHFTSFSVGVGFVEHLNEENTLINASSNIVVDFLDPLDRRGIDTGLVNRTTIDVQVGLSQLLSETTIVDGSIGFAFQGGVLETTWNSVPAQLALSEQRGTLLARTAEVFPDKRLRGVASVRLAQHVPVTHSTLKGSYRFYLDDFGLLGHTAQVALYQYLTDWLYLRGTYRLHEQTGVSFYTEMAAPDLPSRRSRTADSDLAPLTARELGAKLVLVRPQAPAPLRDDDSIDLSYFHYWRTNDMRVHMLSLGYWRTF